MSLAQIRAQREQSRHAPKQEPPECWQVGFDGGWLPSREQKGGMEGKIGVVATQVAAVGKHGRHRLTKRRYVATFGPADELGTLTYAATRTLEATEAKSQVVLGDGPTGLKPKPVNTFPTR